MTRDGRRPSSKGNSQPKSSKAFALRANTVLKIILDATDKQISTESLSHIGAALNLSISGKRSLRFKFRSALQEHLKSLVNDDPELDTSSSVADFFDSFENHYVADHTSFEQLRQKITDHLISGSCTRLSGVEVECDDKTENDLNVSGCAAVCDAWQKDSGATYTISIPTEELYLGILARPDATVEESDMPDRLKWLGWGTGPGPGQKVATRTLTRGTRIRTRGSAGRLRVSLSAGRA
ncbi:hypothetical protein GGX14DRAFT_393914 [Mycena pura]|uniref:Uncharacterized protein n=1 Tax=Mycena pura TaxID=153505 RepID=A0AAD6VJ72_9AGAR|nr:hypothetical protein GGX14DRAFT_393914 [Mycena pura]